MPDGSKLALIIGIDSYRDSLEPLLSCRKDARDITELLSKPEFNYTIFKGKPLIGSELDDKYGWAEVHQAIFQFFGEAKPGQKLLFYFSGHGIPGDNDVFLGTPQIDPKNPRSAGVSLSEITKGMESSKSRDIIVIIDACYSGSAELPDLTLKKKSARNEAKQALAAYDRVWKNIPKSKAIYLMLSSQSYAPSNAVEGSNSLYTQFLLEGLRGIKPHMSDENGHVIEYSGSIEENGEVTPKSLHDYVYHKVANMTDQVPMLRSIESKRFAIVNYPELGRRPRPSQKDNLLQLLKEGKIDEFNEIRRKDNYSRLNFYNVDLKRNDLSHADLRNVDLNLANLIEAKLHYTIFQDASLLRALLIHSQLPDAKLSNANLTHADLSNANLTHADLTRADLSFARLSNADLSFARLSNADLTRADLSSANLSDAYLPASIIIGVNFPDNEKHYPRCKYADFGNTAIIDEEKWCRYFRYNNAKEVPPAIKDKKKLRKKLEKRGFDTITINKYLLFSSLQESTGKTRLRNKQKANDKIKYYTSDGKPVYKKKRQF